MTEKPIYLFAHIPKTGGDTVRAHFWRNLREGRALFANPRKMDIPGTFSALGSEQRSACLLVMGHGVTCSLPTWFPGRAPKFFTILRDPVAHVISSYNWHDHIQQRDHGKAAPDFDRWFTRGKHSLMSRWLVTRFRELAAKYDQDLSQDELVQEASAVLESFWLIADLANLEGTLAPAFEALDVPGTITVSRKVTGRDVPRRLERTPEIEAQIRECATADMRLYERFCASSGN
jgi:hypothetical protein